MTSEAAGHPFRRQLAPAMLQTADEFEDAFKVAPQTPAPLLTFAEFAQMEPEGSPTSKDMIGPFETADVRLFLLAYCACFMAVSAFIL